ncbi:MAG: hypothetical protein IJU16_02785 [Clostridia bacterium]|nr:hypothetical protein [Clostridia bacterium]
MKAIKATAALLLCLLLCAAGWTVTAEETTDSMAVTAKLYSLEMNETQGVITQSPNTPAFWEYPIFRAGERLKITGQLTVRNDGAVSASMEMDEIRLPYGDTDKLDYLNALMITVSEGDQVVYTGSYAHINDAEGGLSLRYEDMAPGEEHTYTISMFCLYSYTGDPYADAVIMPWTFSAVRQVTVMEAQQQGLPLWLIITLGVMLAAIVVMVIISLVRRRTRKVVERTDEDAPYEAED